MHTRFLQRSFHVVVECLEARHQRVQVRDGALHRLDQPAPPKKARFDAGDRIVAGARAIQPGQASER
jgi:hypothetical protein